MVTSEVVNSMKQIIRSFLCNGGKFRKYVLMFWFDRGKLISQRKRSSWQQAIIFVNSFLEGKNSLKNFFWLVFMAVSRTLYPALIESAFLVYRKWMQNWFVELLEIGNALHGDKEFLKNWGQVYFCKHCWCNWPDLLELLYQDQCCKYHQHQDILWFSQLGDIIAIKILCFFKIWKYCNILKILLYIGRISW